MQSRIWRDIPEKTAEYAIILNVSNEVHCIRSLYKLLSSYRDTYSEHCQAFKMERFTKTIIPECRCTTRNISGQGKEVCGTRALR